ncbi:hypothetical protein DPMN_097713 [Dreissena polymorpha]|uniref:Uncharacterized protein n=1 Tax=Dreissena polymorpha TaxID=45954 RepID=A0A9D4R5Z6_DREPO|nr:hypothetical protein DPMN_097713 [Dreissena polymorpha]
MMPAKVHVACSYVGNYGAVSNDASSHHADNIDTVNNDDGNNDTGNKGIGTNNGASNDAACTDFVSFYAVNIDAGVSVEFRNDVA